MLRLAKPQGTPVGTSGQVGSGGVGSQPITDATMLATGDDELVGRSVDLSDAKVAAVDGQRGFFIGPRERQLFVLTQYAGSSATPRIGQNMSVEGFVMQMPSGMPRQLTAPGALNRHIYVYATSID